MSVPDVQKLIDHWNETEFGQLMQDPVMEPFRKDLGRQLEERLSGAGDKLGLTTEDVQAMAGGELAIGVMRLIEDEAPVVLLLDVTGNVDRATSVLDDVSANLVREGAKKSEVVVAETRVTAFDLPDEGRERRVEKAYYVLKGELLIASDSLGIVERILQNLGGRQEATLANVEGFQYVTERVRKDAGETVPQLRWYVQPMGYMKVVQMVEDMRQGVDDGQFVDLFEQEGFDAIQGAGGSIDLAVDDYQLIHRTAIYAPKPWKKAMKMLEFPNRDEFEPHHWVPRDVASYTVLSVDVLTAFDNFGPLFDALFGEGETGVWKDVLDSLRKDPHGPQIDLRSELVAKLGDRLTMTTAYELPITTDSERLLFALKASDEEAVAAAIKKTLQDDKEVRRRVFQQYVIWEAIPPEKTAVPSVQLRLPGASRQGGRAAQERGREDALLPNAAITVAHGHLFIASHYDFLIRTLKQTDARQSLVRTVEYQQVAAALQRLGANGNSAWSFSRTDEEVRPNYELVRKGKMPQAETTLGRVLNSVFGPAEEGTAREQEIQGNKMPEYEVVRRYLGPAGAFATTEDDGWFIKGMMLSK